MLSGILVPLPTWLCSTPNQSHCWLSLLLFLWCLTVWGGGESTILLTGHIAAHLLFPAPICFSLLVSISILHPTVAILNLYHVSQSSYLNIPLTRGSKLPPLPIKYLIIVSYIQVNWGTEKLSNLLKVSLPIMVELGVKPCQSGYRLCLLTTLPYCFSGHIFWMS